MLGLDSELGLLNGLLHLETNVTTHSVGDFGERECSDLHHATHLSFGFIDTLEDLCGGLGMLEALGKNESNLEIACGAVSMIPLRWNVPYFVKASLFRFSKL